MAEVVKDTNGKYAGGGDDSDKRNPSRKPRRLRKIWCPQSKTHARS